MFDSLFTTITEDVSDLFNSGKIEAFDIFLRIKDLFGSLGETVCIIGLVIGILGCFFGFKLTKLFIAICGFAIGAVIGLILSLEIDESYALLLIPVCAIVLAILSYKLYKVGVFVISFLNGASIGLIVSLMLTHDLESASIIAFIIGLIVGIVSVVFIKPVLIISTSINYGNVAGLFLALLLSSDETMRKILPWIFIVAGLLFQIKTNHGLFEGSSQRAANRIRRDR